MKDVRKLLPLIMWTVISITTLLLFLHANDLIQITPVILLFFRLLSIVLLVIYAFRKRSLTTWILVCMVAGAEFGYDVPEVAKKLQVVSEIFLGLSKQL